MLFRSCFDTLSVCGIICAILIDITIYFGWISVCHMEKGIFTMQDMKNGDNFFGHVVQLFRDAKRKMSMAVNMAMVYSYYEAGRLIIDEEQNGSERAAYGKYILQELSRRLTAEFCSDLLMWDG